MTYNFPQSRHRDKEGIDISLMKVLLFDEKSDFLSFAKACGYMVIPNDQSKIIKDPSITYVKQVENFKKWFQKSRFRLLDDLRGDKPRSFIMQTALISSHSKNLPKIAPHNIPLQPIIEAKPTFVKPATLFEEVKPVQPHKVVVVVPVIPEKPETTQQKQPSIINANTIPGIDILPKQSVILHSNPVVDTVINADLNFSKII